MSRIAALQTLLARVREALDGDDPAALADTMAAYEAGLAALRATAGEAAELAALKHEHDQLLAVVAARREATLEALRELGQGRRQSNAYRQHGG